MAQAAVQYDEQTGDEHIDQGIDHLDILDRVLGDMSIHPQDKERAKEKLDKAIAQRAKQIAAQRLEQAANDNVEQEEDEENDGRDEADEPVSPEQDDEGNAEGELSNNVIPFPQHKPAKKPFNKGSLDTKTPNVGTNAPNDASTPTRKSPPPPTPTNDNKPEANPENNLPPEQGQEQKPRLMNRLFGSTVKKANEDKKKSPYEGGQPPENPDGSSQSPDANSGADDLMQNEQPQQQRPMKKQRTYPTRFINYARNRPEIKKLQQQRKQLGQELKKKLALKNSLMKKLSEFNRELERYQKKVNRWNRIRIAIKILIWIGGIGIWIQMALAATGNDPKKKLEEYKKKIADEEKKVENQNKMMERVDKVIAKLQQDLSHIDLKINDLINDKTLMGNMFGS